MYYQNVRGLRTKIDEFFTAASESTYDVIVLTETWLDDAIESCALFDGFAVFRCDRSIENSNKNRGGGVLIAVRNGISATRITVADRSFEHVWTRLKLANCTLVIGAVYIPPDRSTDERFMKRYTDIVDGIVCSQGTETNVIVFGDFNLRTLRWTLANDGFCTVDHNATTLTGPITAFLDGMNLCNMRQLNCTKNHLGNTLDLVFVNEEIGDVFEIDEAVDPLIAIDLHHPPFAVLLSCDMPPRMYFEARDSRALNFRKADYDELRRSLETVDWSQVTMCDDLNVAVYRFTSLLHESFSHCVPCFRPPVKPLWSTRELRNCKKQRNRAQRRYRNARTLANKISFNVLSRQHRNLNLQLYRRYVNKIQRNLTRNPKQFWQFVKSKRKETGLPAAMHFDQQVANTPGEQADLFARFFNSVFVRSSTGDVGDALEMVPQDAVSIDVFEVTAPVLVKAASKLKLSYQPGPDGIPACVLKNCLPQVLQPLLHLFNLSMQQSSFPTAWKSSFMFPVHKKGKKDDVKCYRGITSLCACSKLLEIIVADYLFSKTKQYISYNQHGFFPGRSISTNLTEFCSFCIRQMGIGSQVDAVYTDLKAAFDRVDHAILLSKLDKLGASTQFTEWLRSYLCDRKLAVKIGSSVSEWFSNSSGVPQGSNLGPLLFSIYINDVVATLGEGCCVLYADDTKIYVVVNNVEDCLALQRLLDKFADWCQRNRMTLSIQKCHVITFSRRLQPIEFDYSINGELLSRVETVRDLGVTLDTRLTFNHHYEEIIANARRQLGFIFKMTNEFDDPLCLKSLYISLVRSVLECASVVWDPYHRTVSVRIESIQRKFVRRALRNLPWNDPANLPAYEDRCRLLGLQTLEQRRKSAKAVFIGKLLNGDIDAPNLLAMVDINVPGYPLRNSSFLRLPFRRRDYDFHEPVCALMRAFNEAFNLYDFNVSSDDFRRRLQ